MEYNIYCDESCHLPHDDWYQRIYFLTLREMIDIGHIYHVYVDIKDTKGSEKIDKLRNILNNVVGYFYEETVKTFSYYVQIKYSCYNLQTY